MMTTEQDILDAAKAAAEASNYELAWRILCNAKIYLCAMCFDGVPEYPYYRTEGEIVYVVCEPCMLLNMRNSISNGRQVF